MGDYRDVFEFDNRCGGDLDIRGNDAEVTVGVSFHHENAGITLPRHVALQLRDAISEHFNDYGAVFGVLLEDALEEHITLAAEHNSGELYQQAAYSDGETAAEARRTILESMREDVIRRAADILRERHRAPPADDAAGK